MMSNCFWRVIEGYYQEHQLIDATTGRIVGTVCGSPFREDQGWIAALELTIPSKPLGRYTEENLAKHVVERAVEEEGRRKQG